MDDLNQSSVPVFFEYPAALLGEQSLVETGQQHPQSR
jgi:hypothetical protein